MDKLLKRAFDQLAKEEYEKRLVEIPEHRFSLRFYWKMHLLFQRVGIGKENHTMGDSPMELFRPIRSRRRMAAIALLILMLIGGTVVAAEPIIRWMQNFRVEQNEDHMVIQNDTVDGALEHTKENFRKYRLTEIPEGYSLWMEKFNEGFQRYQISYHNAKEDILSLKQTWQEDDMAENLTSDAEAIENVEVNGFTGYYTEDNGIGSLILSNGVYRLVLEGEFSEKELLELAGGLELND
mgnify:FL=1